MCVCVSVLCVCFWKMPNMKLPDVRYAELQFFKLVTVTSCRRTS